MYLVQLLLIFGSTGGALPNFLFLNLFFFILYFIFLSIFFFHIYITHSVCSTIVYYVIVLIKFEVNTTNKKKRDEESTITWPIFCMFIRNTL